MSVTNLKNFAYNILKKFGDTVKDKEFPELKQCSESNKEIFSHPLKGFTTLQYSQSSASSIVRGMSNQLQINIEVIQEDEEMDDVDELERIAFFEKLIKELKDNNTHQNLLFTSQSPKANSYIHLYQEIVKAEAENDTTNRRARDKVDKEVKEQP
ncbi:6962_t:CDS:2 [Entrophospora sp. SA101]|nr:5931_t:CDS:2 [Entrophospora sp. SA101]CAJ0899966.1 6962_t:CDS:2 [Entrophospora sp. SA101]